MGTPTRRVDAVNGWDAEAIDALYRQWQVDPGAVDPTWGVFFRGFDLGQAGGSAPAAPPVPAAVGLDNERVQRLVRDQMRVDSLIYHYRSVGHTAARLDPLGTEPVPHPRLSLEAHNLSAADLDTLFETARLPLPDQAPLRDIVALLQETYCRTIGVEFMYMGSTDQRYTLARWMEECRNRPALSPQDQRWILQRLVAANSIETFIGRKYTGSKRFSLEGGESLIPLLDTIVEGCPDAGIDQLVLAMAHRGRLNVLNNVVGKAYAMIFTEFEDTWGEDFEEGGGDVKYHRGYSCQRTTRDGRIVDMSLTSNPSHLEAVFPVLLGRTRAKQMTLKDTENRSRVLPICIHGDAAFAGQGVVYEGLQLSQLPGYTVGGTVHVVINNQIGFTTFPHEGRSTPYCTDLVKMLEAPVFHVNGNDPEAVVHCAKLALRYRQEFHQDVVIDLYCYRRHGHNEGDEPTYTQPGMYDRIRQAKPVHQLYAEQLIGAGVLDDGGYKQMTQDLVDQMEAAQKQARVQPVDPTPDPFSGDWYGIQPEYTHDLVPTGVNVERLETVADALVRVPEGFNVHPKVAKLMADRKAAVYGGGPIDWGTAESLAYGSLLLEGTPIRISGQDVRRGTFSHRHAVLVDMKTGAYYAPLDHILDEQGHFCCHNSPLSEFAVLGYEYGYSVQAPRMLVIWEAQFGDFANGAQVIVDQFIASAEVKWERCSGLVMLLPHGYEGQGPEHSSARMERFLQLCGDDNMEVAYPSSPAQFFHLLRRQMRRAFRKPLVVFTPKSMLRDPVCVSPVSELADGHFNSVLDDTSADPAKVRRLLMCTGKVYYALDAARRERQRDDLAIVRVEQLSPFPAAWLNMAVKKYKRAEQFAWVQEEPRNMGAWTFVEPRIRDLLPDGAELQYVGRRASASPAVGSLRAHNTEQQTVVEQAIGLAPRKPLKAAEPVRDELVK